MLEIINDHILIEMARYTGAKLKMGIYSNCSQRRVQVMVEPMVNITEYPQVYMETPIEQCIPSHKKYFAQNFPNTSKNPVFRYDFSFFIFMNGVRVNSPLQYFTPNDSISIKWAVERIGEVFPDDYFSFLWHAYKLNTNFNATKYNGNWPNDVTAL